MSDATHEHEFFSGSPEATTAWGRAVAAACAAGDVIALDGELGAGKTQFTRGLAEGLGIDPGVVSSPTFVLMREYEREEGGACGEGIERLIHIDAYRLSDLEELATLGWEGGGEEIRAGSVVAVEWADRVREALGPDVLGVELSHAPGGRRIWFSPSGAWRAKIEKIEQPAS